MHKLGRFSRFTPKSRRGKIVAGITGFLVSIGIGVGIAAIFASHAPISGGVSGGTFTAMWDSGFTPQVVDHAGSTCTVANGPSGSLVLNVTDSIPGGSCTVEGRMDVAGLSQKGVVTGVDLTLPAGWTATVTKGCGAVVDPVVGNPSNWPLVDVKVAMDESAGNGAGSFGPSDGVAVSPQSLNPTLNCTP